MGRPAALTEADWFELADQLATHDEEPTTPGLAKLAHERHGVTASYSTIQKALVAWRRLGGAERPRELSPQFMHVLVTGFTPMYQQLLAEAREAFEPRLAAAEEQVTAAGSRVDEDSSMVPVRGFGGFSVRGFGGSRCGVSGVLAHADPPTHAVLPSTFPFPRSLQRVGMGTGTHHQKARSRPHQKARSCSARLKATAAIPDLPVYLDSPMAIDATGLYDSFAAEHKVSVAERALLWRDVRLVRTADASHELDSDTQPKLILAASGMATGDASCITSRFLLPIRAI